MDGKCERCGVIGPLIRAVQGTSGKSSVHWFCLRCALTAGTEQRRYVG